MNKQQLKEKLITIGLCEDNEWLDKYVELIVENQSTEKIKYETQRHHIVPRNFFEYNNEKIDNSDDNLVNLFTIDHCRAHAYLALAGKNFHIRSANANAVAFITSRDFNSDGIRSYEDFVHFFDDLESIEFKNYVDFSKSEETREKFSLLRWCNNGEEEHHYNIEEGIPEGFIEGRLPGVCDGSGEGYIWINNGVEEHSISPEDLYLYPGFVPGMLDRGEEWRSKAGRYERTEEVRNRMSIGRKKFFSENPDYRNDGMWKPGEPSFNAGMLWVTNIIENHFIFEDDLSEWEAKGFWRGTTKVLKSYLDKMSFTTPDTVFDFYKEHSEQETADYFNVTFKAICGYIKHFKLKERKLILPESSM